MTTFVYEGVEVRKTGRTATRKLGGTGRTPVREMTQVEITPVDPDMGWKKWVDPNTLFIVNEVTADA